MKLNPEERAGVLVATMNALDVPSRELSELTGRHPDSIQKWRNGRQEPRRSSEFRIASALAACDDRRFSTALFPPLCRLRPLQEPGGERAETVLACPECDDAAVYAHGTGLNSTHDTPRWRCDACGAKFDDGIERERRSLAPFSLSGLARKLDKMDPDELSAP